MAGGRRQGAGRKPGKVNESKRILQEAIDRVAKQRGGYERLIDALWESAEGVMVEEVKRGVERVYSKPPDSFASKILLEFRFGKAPQTHELTGEDGGPVDLNVTGEFFDELAKRFFPKPEKGS